MGDNAEELQSAIDITLRRFAEYQSLQGALGRRATIEQANGRKLIDVAHAVVDSHPLLMGPAAAEPEGVWPDARTRRAASVADTASSSG